MQNSDFTFDHYSQEGQEYWFQVSGVTRDELERRHLEREPAEILLVAYSYEHKMALVMRTYNGDEFDEVYVDDDELEDRLSYLTHLYQMNEI